MNSIRKNLKSKVGQILRRVYALVYTLLLYAIKYLSIFVLTLCQK
jgi:hypothetical protein